MAVLHNTQQAYEKGITFKNKNIDSDIENFKI